VVSLDLAPPTVIPSTWRWALAERERNRMKEKVNAARKNDSGAETREPEVAELIRQILRDGANHRFTEYSWEYGYPYPF
jgi:hypothetical protein